MSLFELREVAKSLDMPSFSGGQIARWLSRKQIKSIDEMTDLSKQSREKLKEHFEMGCNDPVEQRTSEDGTIKYLFPVSDGKYVETVFIPEKEHATLCVSSQVGCKMNCLFCQTGKQGFHGNLTTADILNQIYSLPERGQLSNIVFMGQGEPLDNVENVLRATRFLTSEEGFAWSPRRITVSTVGVRNQLNRFLEESSCHLAISLHSPFHEERAAIMPAEKAYPIAEIIGLLRNYDFSHQRRLSFEYIVLKGLNDSKRHADAILRLLKGLDCRVNLIQFHPIPNVDLKGVGDEEMIRLRNYLTQGGVFTTVRANRGQDIFAACGLLSTAKQIADEKN